MYQSMEEHMIMQVITGDIETLISWAYMPSVSDS